MRINPFFLLSKYKDPEFIRGIIKIIDSNFYILFILYFES